MNTPGIKAIDKSQYMNFLFLMFSYNVFALNVKKTKTKAIYFY